MNLDHRSDIRIDHEGLALVLAVAFLAVVLTTATLWGEDHGSIAPDGLLRVRTHREFSASIWKICEAEDGSWFNGQVP